MDLDNIKDEMLTEEEVYDLSSIYKVLGDVTRCKILYCLMKAKSLCVNDICKCVDMTKSAVSHQLRILRDAKLVKTKKIGKEVYYSFDDEHIEIIFKYGLEHINERY